MIFTQWVSYPCVPKALIYKPFLHSHFSALDINTTVSTWPETVEDRWNIVVGEDTDRQQLRRENIINAVRSFEPNKKQHNIFGNRKAAE